MTTLQTIPLNRLVQSKSNVRKTGKSKSLDALMASIAAHGLRQNLNVKPTSGNRFEVVAGGRRLAALKRLAKDGRLGTHSPVACLVLDEAENPSEISLTENSIREDMHPDDQCVAFQELIAGGQSVDDVAARFGVTPAVVRQRLKLASVSPALRKLFRSGALDLAQLMAFALVDDHAAQETAWNDLPDWNRDADAIRHALIKDGVAADHRLARFVGIDAYEAAGGTVLCDLFGGDESTYLVDAALLQKLAMRRLEEEAAHVQAEGWKWVKVELKADYGTSYGRVYPATIEGSDDATYLSADIMRAGARVTLGYDGTLSIERGLLDKDAMKADRSRPGTAEAAAAVPAFSAAVVEDLTAHRTAALRLELAHNPAAALAATVHALALKAFYPGAYGTESCLALSLRSEALESHVSDVSECSAHGALAGEIAAWQSTLPTDQADLWAWCLTQDRDRLLELLALLAGLSVNAICGKQEGANTPRLRHADRLADTLNLDMHTHWQPSPDGFFSRLSKGLMTHLLNEAGESQQAAVLPKVKKTEAAHRTASALMAKGWLPAPLLPAPVDAHHDHADDDGAAAGDDHDADDLHDADDDDQQDAA